jgi:hypothetical protein
LAMQMAGQNEVRKVPVLEGYVFAMLESS